jgi:DNA-binding HxlR family transcriptional regulator
MRVETAGKDLPMLGRLYEGQDCSAARTLEIVGERWSLLILRDALFAGHTHFSDFQKSLGIAANILARRLEAFVAAGIMKAVPTSSHPNHFEYVLTTKGQEFKHVIVALTAWGDKWLGPGPIEYVHATCGGIIHQHFHCGQCGADPPPTEVRVRLRKGRSAPPGSPTRNHVR